jgi:competence protein ComEA
VSLSGLGDARAQGKDLDGVVNLNTATAELLELLPGVGPAKVRSILSYRQRRPFRTIDELVRIKGIGRKMVRHLRAHLAVSGPTTAHPVHRPREPDPPPPPPRPPPARQPPTPTLAASRARAKNPRPAPAPSSWANHCAPPP